MSRGVGRPRCNSADNYGSSVNGSGHDNMFSVNTNRGVVRPSRENHGSSRGRGEGRSSSASSDVHANSSMITLNNGIDHSIGNASRVNSGIIRHSRSRSGLRVRFSDEVNSSDDPPDRRGGSNRSRNHIRNNRHSSCDSYFDSRDSNQVTPSVVVGNYNSGSSRRNLYDHADIDVSRSTIFGGYECGGIACRNDVYENNSIRHDSVVRGRSSIRGSGGGYITNNIRGISGVCVRSSDARGRGDGRHARGVVIREITNGIGDSDQDGENDYESNHDYNGFYHYADDYDDDGNYGSGGGGSIGGGRIRRLLPRVPLMQQMFWFKTYLNHNHSNFIFYN